MSAKIKYSNEELLKILKDYNDNVGVPTQRKFKTKFGLPSYSLYILRFGSFSNAMNLAGLKVRKEYLNRESMSDEELLNILKQYVAKHLETNIFLPTYGDFRNNKICPDIMTYNDRFKGIKNMYKLIGYDYEDFNYKAKIKDMKNKYIELCNDLGHIADSREINKYSNNNKYYYCMSAYINNFGSLHNLQKELKLDLTGRIEKTDEQMLDELIRLEKELGRIPMQKDIDECKYTSSSSVYCKHFGSFLNALELIGHKDIRKHRKQYITNKGTKCLSFYEYSISNMLENRNINYNKEEYYANYIDGIKNKYRFDFTVIINNNTYFIEIFGIVGNSNYDNKTKEKIKLCKNNCLKLIELYPEDFKSYDENYLYNLIIDKIHRLEEK